MIEGFFGRAKRSLRRACGTGSTANSVAQNVGADYLAAFALSEAGNDRLATKLGARDLANFRQARARIAASEAPATRRRSLVRHFDRHVAALRSRLGLRAPG
jgi:hypothetical protein